jgi:hypothetical protein
MAVVTQIVGARTSLTISGFNSLGNGSYATSDAYNCTTDDPLDVIVEVNVLPGATTGNQQVVVFAVASLDGTNYQTGPVAADEAVLNFVGTVPVITDSTAQRKMFSVASAFSGVLPAYFKIICKNDSGAALSGSGNTLFTATVVGNVA